MKRALTLGLMLIATAVTAAELQLSTKHTELRALASSREVLGQKTQWAPSGNFSALHGRAVFRGEIRSESRPYARARGEVASGIGIFLSRDSIGASSYLQSPNGMGPWSYANLSPARFTDPDGRRSKELWEDLEITDWRMRANRMRMQLSEKNPIHQLISFRIRAELSILDANINGREAAIKKADDEAPVVVRGSGAGLDGRLPQMQPIEGYGDLPPLELQESPHWFTPDFGDAFAAHMAPNPVNAFNAASFILAPLAARGARPNTSFGPQPEYARGAPLEPLARSTGPLAPGPVTVSGALSGPSRGFASWTADVRARQRAEAGRSWLATPEAREGFAEYMAELGVPGEFAPGMYWETEAGPSRSQNPGGPVVFRPPPNATAAQVAQVQAYVAACNRALQSGQLSSTGRVSTTGALRRAANRAARDERARAAQAGTPYQGAAGHGPDTTWTNNPSPPEWLDLDTTVNSSLGGQCNGYPVGYEPTVFTFAP